MSCCGNKKKKEPLLPVPTIESEELYTEFLQFFDSLKENPTITESKAHQSHSLFTRIYKKDTAFNQVSVGIAIRNLKNAYGFRENLLKKPEKLTENSEKNPEITFILNEKPYKYEFKDGVYVHLEGGYTKFFKKNLSIEEVEGFKSDNRIQIIQ